MGAIASGGVHVINQDFVSHLHIESLVEDVIRSEMRELQRREHLYRGTRPALDLNNRTIIIVDDGLATGSTMRAAVKALRQRHPKKIVVAVPVGARETCDSFKQDVDTMAVCAITPTPFRAVGMWYQDFSQTTDEEVINLLARSAHSKVAA